MGLFLSEKAPFQGAIFGLNGTLIDSERWFRQAWWNILARRGLRYRDYNAEWHMGLSQRSYFRIIMRRFGIEEDEDAFVAEWRQEARALVKENAKVCPGVRRTLRSLRRYGVRMAVTTGSSTETTRYLLAKLRLAKWFEFIVTRSTLAKYRLLGKPAQDPYLSAMTSLGLSSLACIAFEDSIAGIVSAKAACCRTVIGVVNCPDMKRALVDARRMKMYKAGADLAFSDLGRFRLRTHFPSI